MKNVLELFSIRSFSLSSLFFDIFREISKITVIDGVNPLVTNLLQEFIKSLSKNNAQNGTSLPYDGTATIGGYQSLAVSGNQAGRKCLDLNGNVTAVNISEFSAAGIGGGIVDVFCVKV